MPSSLAHYYKIPVTSPSVGPAKNGKKPAGFFRFGADVICYGECSTGVANDIRALSGLDASKAVNVVGSEIRLPFDFSEIVDNLRNERYVGSLHSGLKAITRYALVRDSYYLIRELLPVWFRRHLQRAYFKDWQSLPFPNWPVDFTVDRLHEILLRLTMQARGFEKIPFIWFWPDGASNCLIITHDVETAAGRDFAPSLMEMDLSHGFKSSFQIVPERRYQLSDSFVSEIRGRGFEFNVHDWNHDGRLFEEKTEFLKRARQINEFAKKHGARGFRSGAMYRNQDWYDAFEFSYDMSVPNVAHLEPQRGGCCTVMPYFIGDILEIPLTASQDYTLFSILNDYSIDLWKKQTELIVQKHGLLSFITHPDYLIDQRARAVYESLLTYLREICERTGAWRALPGELDRWWRSRTQMKLVEDGSEWRIEGPDSDRARLAYASLDGDQFVYTIQPAQTSVATATAAPPTAIPADAPSQLPPTLRAAGS
jgi:hypothetical protein